MALTDSEVLDEFRAAEALLEGHYILTSGLRSRHYLQCARVLMDPSRAARLVAALVPDLRLLDAGLVVSPAMGGVVFGYEVGRQLGITAIFTERVDGRFALRRGFEIEAGTRVLIAEDVVTTGLSTRECIAACREHGADVVGIAALIDRSAGHAAFDVPFCPLVTLDIPTYAPDALPDDLAALPAVKPGSRYLAP